jgi:uncharacterized protein (TIGR03382 family)
LAGQEEPALAVLAGIWILYVIVDRGDWLYYIAFSSISFPVLLLSGALLLRRRRVLLGVYLVLILIGFTALETNVADFPGAYAGPGSQRFFRSILAMTEAEDGETVAMGRIGYFGYRNMRSAGSGHVRPDRSAHRRTPEHEEVGLKAHDHYDAITS